MYRKLADQSVWLAIEKQLSRYMRRAITLVLTADYTLLSRLNVGQFTVYLDAICILGLSCSSLKLALGTFYSAVIAG